MPAVPGKQNGALTPPQRDTMVFAAPLGVDTTNARTDIAATNAYYLENLCPQGNGNLLTIPNVSAALATFSGNPYGARGINLNNREYVRVFSSDGTVWLYDIVAQTATQVGSGLSGAGSQCAMWTNAPLLMIDSTGYYSWDGTTFTHITGTGVPSGGDTIEVFQGRVWISSGRTVYFSGAGGFDSGATDGTNYWLPQNGAGFHVLTDPKVRSAKLTGMHGANGLLFLYHLCGVNVISNVNVPLGLIPPTPTLEDDNIESVAGTDQGSISAFGLYDIYSSRMGASEMYGITRLSLSDSIQETWKYIDWTKAVSCAQFVLNGQQWGAYCFSRLNDPNFPDGYTIGVFGQGAQGYNWWFINAGAVNLIVTGWVGGTPQLFGFIGNQIYQIMADTTTAPGFVWQTRLAPMEDPLATKETLQCGVQADFFSVGTPTNLQLYLENENQSNPVSAMQWPTSISGNYQRYFPNAGMPNLGGRSVGFKLVSSGGWQLRLRLMAIDYMVRERWGLP
jgi:hypothetical protein